MSSTYSGDALQQARDWLRQQTGREPPDNEPLDEQSADRSPDEGSAAGRPPDERSAADGSQDAFGPTSPAPPAGPTADPRAEPTADPDDPDADPESVARAILVRKLAAQDRSRHELASALAAKNVPDEVAEQLLDRFEAVGLVDDQGFARRWVESRQGRRYRSRVALRRELTGKGIDRAVVDEAVSQVSHDDDLAAAQGYVDKTARQMSELHPTVRRRRLADRLARRGFSTDVISRVLKDSTLD